MTTTPLHLLLADDDLDGCTFFKEAPEELPVRTKLTTINGGMQLMQLLSEKEDALPDALFLDLNMPRKNGFDGLAEIKPSEKVKQLPVIIFSTSFNIEVVNFLYEQWAHYYICRPAEFSNLKKIIFKSINLISDAGNEKPVKEKFVLTPA